MIPTHIALRLAAERQREFESRAALRRLAQHLADEGRGTRRIDTVLPALRRFATTLGPQRRPAVGTQPAAAPATRCCAA